MGGTWKTYNLNNNSFTLEFPEVFCCFILLFALDQEEKRDTDLSVEIINCPHTCRSMSVPLEEKIREPVCCLDQEETCGLVMAFLILILILFLSDGS